MKKISFVLLITFSVSACTKLTLIEHHFSMKYYEDSDIKVCVDDPITLVEIDKKEIDSYYTTVDGISYKKSQNPDDKLETTVVDYDYCLPQDRRIRNFSTKKIKDVEVCYERVSKIELPMSYCLPDTNVNVNVSQHTNVSQSTVLY